MVVHLLGKSGSGGFQGEFANAVLLPLMTRGPRGCFSQFLITRATGFVR